MRRKPDAPSLPADVRAAIRKLGQCWSRIGLAERWAIRALIVAAAKTKPTKPAKRGRKG